MKRILMSVFALCFAFSLCGCAGNRTPSFKIAVPYMEVYAEYDTWSSLKGTIEVTCTDKSKDYMVLMSCAFPTDVAHYLCYVHKGTGQLTNSFYAENTKGGSVKIVGYAAFPPAKNDAQIGQFAYRLVEKWEDYYTYRGESKISTSGGGNWLVAYKRTIVSGGMDSLIGFTTDNTTAAFNGNSLIQLTEYNRTGEVPVCKIENIRYLPLEEIDPKLMTFGKWDIEENSYEDLDSTRYMSVVEIKPEFNDIKLVCFLLTLRDDSELPAGTEFMRTVLFTDGMAKQLPMEDFGKYQKIGKPEYDIKPFGAISFKPLDASLDGMSFSWDDTFYKQQ